MANVCCSIEMEPRTLNQCQLNHAREMAADVVQKMEPNEASASFEVCNDKTSIKIKGIELVISGVEIKEMVNDLTLTDDEGLKRIGVEEYLFNQKEKASNNIVELERPCQCSCQTDNIESPDHRLLKEPVTAPF